MAEFSPDHRWWWTGEAWAPATSPDGSFVHWDGFRWVREQDLTRELRILSAIGLLFVDVIYVAVVLFILLLGASDVSGTDVLVKSLLVFGIAVAQVVSAAILARLFRRAWWALSLLAAWPFWVLLVPVAVNPDARSGVTDGQLCLREPVVVNLRCPQRVRSQLVDGALYRVNRTRLTHYLVNFERINAERASGPGAHSSFL